MNTIPTSVGGTDVFLPASFALEQNYPNPFNPSTSITFNLPNPGTVRLTIYTILGEKVETIIDDSREAGTHRIEWVATHPASGVYLCT